MVVIYDPDHRFHWDCDNVPTLARCHICGANNKKQKEERRRNACGRMYQEEEEWWPSCCIEVNECKGGM